MKFLSSAYSCYAANAHTRYLHELLEVEDNHNSPASAECDTAGGLQVPALVYDTDSKLQQDQNSTG
jgi:hypothetical protein